MRNTTGSDVRNETRNTSAGPGETKRNETKRNETRNHEHGRTESSSSGSATNARSSDSSWCARVSDSAVASLTHLAEKDAGGRVATTMARVARWEIGSHRTKRTRAPPARVAEQNRESHTGARAQTQCRFPCGVSRLVTSRPARTRRGRRARACLARDQDGESRRVSRSVPRSVSRSVSRSVGPPRETT